jgi:hypothetical protein
MAELTRSQITTSALLSQPLFAEYASTPILVSGCTGKSTGTGSDDSSENLHAVTRNPVIKVDWKGPCGVRIYRLNTVESTRPTFKVPTRYDRFKTILRNYSSPY